MLNCLSYKNKLSFYQKTIIIIMVILMKIKRRKIKKGPLIKLIIVILLLILIIVGVKKIIYLNSDEYKLKEIGYNKKQIIEILKLDKIYKKKIMSIDYNEFLLALFKEKYLITDNIDRYISYQKEHKDVSTKDIVAIVNVNGDYDHYTNTSETNIDDDLLMLVNKYNYLSKDYKPQNIVDVKNWYCYGNAQLREDAYDAFIDMFNSAQKDDITLIINSAYRDYEDQDDTYQEFYDLHGKDEADKIAARPGFSEHQTGLAIDLTSYDETKDKSFEETKEFKWLQQNAYKYGFILRYPKGKEAITGYDYESWHYRYVGTEVAQKIHDLDITFDEYYTYFVK